MITLEPTLRGKTAFAGRLILLLLPTLLMWLAAINVPTAATNELDSSWQAMLVDAHLHDRQFGEDVIFTAGPWAWLTSTFLVPGVFASRLWGDIVLKLLCAVALTAVGLRLPWGRRWLLAIAAPLCAGLFPDTTFTVTVTLVIAWWFFDPRTPVWVLAAAMPALTLLEQIKFSFLLLIGTGITLAAISLALQGHRRRAVGIVGGAIGAFLFWWLAAGQSVANLPAFILNSLDVAAAYADGMGVEESWPVFAAGVSVLGLGGWFVVTCLRDNSAWRRTAPAALFIGAAWFLAWKHGFTRADGHVLSFFCFALIVGPTLPVLFFPQRRLMGFDCVVLVAVLGIGLFDTHFLRVAPPLCAARVGSGWHAVTSPGAVRAGFEQAWQREQAANAWPEIKAIVGDSTIDAFTYRIGGVWLNGLNYHPRPIAQSYQACRGSLERVNRRFFRSLAAPEFVLFRHDIVDGRFPTLDDALVLAELPLRYEVATDDGRFALLRRKPDAAAISARAPELLDARGLRLNEDYVLPVDRTHALWLQVEAHASILGKVRRLLYKPAQLHLIATDSFGRQSHHRLIVDPARSGFIIQPFLETQHDVNAFFAGEGRSWVKSIRLVPAAPDQDEYWSGAIIKLSRLPDLPITGVDPLGAYLDSGFTNLAITSITSDLPVAPLDLGNRPALLVHANGEIQFQLDERRCFTGWYGIRNEAYQGANHTTGADFSVEAEFADGRREVLWERRLQPGTVEGDRGAQRLTLTLPPNAVRLFLRTGMGPNNSPAWDWTYWMELSFNACPAN